MSGAREQAISNMSSARQDPGVADHISYPPRSLANASEKKCNFRLRTQQDLEELVLLYRFMPSIPRETLKTCFTRSNDLNFPQLYKLELASLTRLSPDDGCNRLASVTPSNENSVLAYLNRLQLTLNLRRVQRKLSLV